MNSDSCPAGLIIISHGSPRAEVNRRFTAMVERIAARLGMDRVLPAFFSIARPNILDRVAELAALGVQRVVLMPYFLYSGQHVTHDIPALLDECRRRFPGVALEVLPTLENDPAIEDLVLERLTAAMDVRSATPTLGKEIERRSYEIIARQLDGGEAAAGGLSQFSGATGGLSQFSSDENGTVPFASAAAQRQIVARIVHATADFSFARSLRIHPQAVDRGRAALAAGKAVLCDVKMLQAGLTKVRNETLCAIDRPEVLAAAQAAQCTRAAAAMESLRPQLDGAIVAVGNAPTALWKIIEIAAGGGPRPALVVGLPVGLVGAREAKLALWESGLCCITNTTSRGGSPAAAAAVNALAAIEEERIL